MSRPRGKPMRLVNIRIPEPIYDEIRRIAEASGISVAQYFREAALMRVARDEIMLAATGSKAPPDVVVRAFADHVAQHAEKLGAPEMGEGIRRQYER